MLSSAKESTILLQKIETKGTHAATAGETNIEIFEDYRHVPVLSAYAPLEIEGVDWAIMAEIDEEEALRAATTLGKQMMMISVCSPGCYYRIEYCWFSRSQAK